MAKSTAHKALAALKHKLDAALGELFATRSALSYEKHNSVLLAVEQRDAQFHVWNLTRRLNNKDVELKNEQDAHIRTKQELADAKLQVNRRYAHEYGELCRAYKGANRQVINLQNRNEKLRSDFESYKNGAWIYSIVAVVAAYAAGVAVQQWFPLGM